MDERSLWQLGDEELLAALRTSQQRLSRAYAEQLALLGELLVRNLTPVLGYRTPARLVQDLMRIGQAEANRRLAHAAAVTATPGVSGGELTPLLPVTAEAVRTGTVGVEHLEVIRRVLTALPPEVPATEKDLAERTLVEAAHTSGPAAVAKLGRAIRGRLDHYGSPASEGPARRPVNELRWVVRGGGELAFTGRLAAEGAALLTTVLGPLAKPRPAVDGEPDPRSRAERNGEALVDALRLAANSGDLPSGGGERPTLVVTMTVDALREQAAPALLGDTGMIDARTARRLACDSAVIPAVLNGRSEPLDIGRKTRTVPVPMRRALVLRDHGCAFPGCTVPASWCDAHHCQHWADGGTTALSNLVLLCGVHHELIHNSDWQVRLPDGVPEFIPPPYIDPERRPRRNPVHPGAP